MTVSDLKKETLEKLESEHVGCFKGHTKPLLLISQYYPGVWLEHVYDSVFYAKMDPSKLYLAENTVELFISLQKESGQLPCYIWDGNKRSNIPPERLVGYGQIQECVSFAKLCFEVYKMNQSKVFLQRIYDASMKWEGWFRKYRMTEGKGLVEVFIGYDTGHDYSGRLKGLSHVKGYCGDATALPPDDPVAPMIAVDLNCNYYATLMALSNMADALGRADEALEWKEKAGAVKARLFETCFDGEDCFFYDVDRHGNKRKFLSSTIFHLFMEGVLDPVTDAELIRELYERHIANPSEFATPYPFPSMAICDPSCEGHRNFNCWGYYSQGLIALRCTMWMDEYGFSKEFDHLCSQWVKAWTKHYDTLKMGQELDPITGEPTRSSEWYSSCMLFYLYAANRIEQKGLV